MRPRRTAIVCSIGSVDPIGAAGLVMDLRVFSRLGAVGVAAVAGVTAQNSRRVVAISAVAPALIRKQLEAIWEQTRPESVCIGLLPSVPAIRAVEQFLRGVSPRPPIVMDPVMASSSGRRFLQAPAVRELARLLPLVTLVTPNLEEAAALSGLRVTTLTHSERAALAIASRGCAVLVTGGHLPGGRCVDVFAQNARVCRFASARLAGTMRGSGGILAAAIATNLAQREPLRRAIALARRFVRRAHRAARPLGSGTRQFMTH